MYRLIKEAVEVEPGLCADLLVDGESVELAIAPHGAQPVYLIPIDCLTANSKEGFDPGQMRNDSYRVFNTYADYCKWFNQKVCYDTDL